ncbi:hypothetical protein U4Z66_13885 [Escherichia coli]|uniref:hypothetical protein n=1 Tax=Escherichia coli TaxID=562 RepID=UPI0017CEC889|nr:hypothetical protein [Escherichia coli]MBC0424023.1 hypothetical protein [Escherichia coli]MDZ6936579.1 hypothetical protein [Escherichia coli]HAH7004981.1 hypothetical protein [Escherichia coli]HAO0101747.1 hypothetical protein [Escherichia coli]
MDYFLGGYMLLHCLPVEGLHPQLKGKPLLTCSTCFNESLLCAWSYAWLGSDKDSPYNGNMSLYEHLEATFLLTDEDREQIRIRANDWFNEDKVGWESIFMDKSTAIEYKQSFFPHIENCYLLAIYIREPNVQEFSLYPSHDGIAARLLRRQPERNEMDEKLLGYDILGLEIGGQFHTSHCHPLYNELHQRFGLTLNQHGLYNEIPDWQPVVDYMNDDATGCEPVPWGIARIKQVIF